MATETDPTAIECFRRYLVALARIQISARPWLATKLDASDLVQQTLLKAHDAREQFRGDTPGEMAAWLRQILSRTLSNELRAYGQARRDTGAERSLEPDVDASSRRLDAWLAADQTSPSGRAEQGEKLTSLAAAVESLPVDQREVVLLKHCHGLTLAELAARTGRTPAAVAGLLRRGLEQLRHLLGEEVRP